MSDLIGNEPDPNADPNANPNPTPDPNAKPDEIPGWLANIEDENLKNEPTLRRFKGDNAQALAVSYMDLRRKVGEHPIVKPKDDAKPEEWDAYYKAIGRPDTPTDYKFTPIEGLDVDTDMQYKFSEISHSIGLTGGQADKLNQWVGELALQLQSSEKTKMDEESKAAEKTLREAWGSQYDANIKLADKAMRYHGGEELKTALKDAGLLRNATVIQFFQKLAVQTGEDALKGVGEPGAQGAKYTREQLEKMMQSPDYWSNPALQKKVQDGFKDLYPGVNLAAPTERGEGRAAITG